MSFRQILATEFAAFRVLSEQELSALEAHFELLLRWNQKVNLTRITDPVEAARFHYCESLFLALRLPPGSLSIADVGSGAGFPGIPIAVFRPECSVALIESDQRKAIFLREATREMKNVRVLARRAEHVAERFDWVVSRAVAQKDLLHLRLAPNFALLTVGDVGEPLPWGEKRCLEMVSRGTGR
ncbi:MAG: 16S rRNA (guanine(527)-N(7))-methyltransferase RsmG [Bryobacteraceae bacterium]